MKSFCCEIGLVRIDYSMIRILEDANVVIEKDPSAKSLIGVLFTSNGIRALWAYRVAHWFYNRRLFLVASLISRHSTAKTAIEIHSGAKIGRRVFIDHGLGVVIGETAEVGDDVTIYQGVTLGSRGNEKGKRHPTIERGVMLGAGAKILGNIVIGEYSKIGAGSVVVDDIPPYSTVVGKKAQIVKINSK